MVWTYRWFLELKFTKFMLKKHPIVVETMKRLRRYVGNTKNWGFTDKQKEEFDEKAGKVRNLAESIYNSFKVGLLSKNFYFNDLIPVLNLFRVCLLYRKEEHS